MENLGRVVAVCGPPAAGKTSYVKERAKAGDLVVDLDALYSALTGLAEHERAGDPSLLRFAQAAAKAVRLAVGHALRDGGAPARVWMIRTAADPLERSILAVDYAADVVVLPCPLEVCLERIAADPVRRARPELAQAVREWHRAYKPAPHDRVGVTW